MKSKTYLNGSRETPAQAVARIEERLNKLRNDLQALKNPRKPTNGFKNFANGLIERRN